MAALIANSSVRQGEQAGDRFLELANQAVEFLVQHSHSLLRLFVLCRGDCFGLLLTDSAVSHVATTLLIRARRNPFNLHRSYLSFTPIELPAPILVISRS
jgi:hypothetical protein